MKIITVLLDLLNGKKLNTGTIMILAVFVLKYLGMTEGEAQSAATNIMLGIGGVFAVWGYIHRMYKSFKEKKQ